MALNSGVNIMFSMPFAGQPNKRARRCITDFMFCTNMSCSAPFKYRKKAPILFVFGCFASFLAFLSPVRANNFDVSLLLPNGYNAQMRPEPLAPPAWVINGTQMQIFFSVYINDLVAVSDRDNVRTFHRTLSLSLSLPASLSSLI